MNIKNIIMIPVIMLGTLCLYNWAISPNEKHKTLLQKRMHYQQVDLSEVAEIQGHYFYQFTAIRSNDTIVGTCLANDTRLLGAWVVCVNGKETRLNQ